jgi:hypothetical protein
MSLVRAFLFCYTPGSHSSHGRGLGEGRGPGGLSPGGCLRRTDDIQNNKKTPVDSSCAVLATTMVRLITPLRCIPEGFLATGQSFSTSSCTSNNCCRMAANATISFRVSHVNAMQSRNLSEPFLMGYTKTYSRALAPDYCKVATLRALTKSLITCNERLSAPRLLGGTMHCGTE